MSEHQEEESSAKAMMFRAMVWAVGILLTLTGVGVGYIYRSNQESIMSRFESLDAMNAKQWDRITLIERRQDAIEWLSKQNQIDLATLKSRR